METSPDLTVAVSTTSTSSFAGRVTLPVLEITLSLLDSQEIVLPALLPVVGSSRSLVAVDGILRASISVATLPASPASLMVMYVMLIARLLLPVALAPNTSSPPVTLTVPVATPELVATSKFSLITCLLLPSG